MFYISSTLLEGCNKTQSQSGLGWTKYFIPIIFKLVTACENKHSSIMFFVNTYEIDNTTM